MPGLWWGYDLLMKICDSDGVEITKGDMLCLHTGFADVIVGMAGQPDAALLNKSCAVLDGHDKRLLQWISEEAASRRLFAIITRSRIAHINTSVTDAMPCCRCMSSVCSSSDFTSASSGI